MVLTTRKCNFGSQQWLPFHIWFIMALYYKMRKLFYYKVRQKFFIKCDSFYTECESYYKVRRLLQNASAQRFKFLLLFDLTVLEFEQSHTQILKFLVLLQRFHFLVCSEYWKQAPQTPSKSKEEKTNRYLLVWVKFKQ